MHRLLEVVGLMQHFIVGLLDILNHVVVSQHVLIFY